MRTTKSYARETIFSGDITGLDSIQGYLEFSHTYNGNKEHISFVCNKKDVDRHGTLLFDLKQLEETGDVVLSLEDYVSDTEDSGDYYEIEQLSLTPQGHKHLYEIKQLSRSGALKKRIVNLLWVIAASIITTLTVLKIKGL